MSYKRANDRFNVVFIKVRTQMEEGRKTVVILVTTDNFNLVIESYLRVRDNKSRHERMGFATDTAANPADADRNRLWKAFQQAGIITMYSKAGRVAAGTG